MKMCIYVSSIGKTAKEATFQAQNGASGMSRKIFRYPDSSKSKIHRFKRKGQGLPNVCTTLLTYFVDFLIF